MPRKGKGTKRPMTLIYACGHHNDSRAFYHEWWYVTSTYHQTQDQIDLDNKVCSACRREKSPGVLLTAHEYGRLPALKGDDALRAEALEVRWQLLLQARNRTVIRWLSQQTDANVILGVRHGGPTLVLLAFEGLHKLPEIQGTEHDIRVARRARHRLFHEEKRRRALDWMGKQIAARKIIEVARGSAVLDVAMAQEAAREAGEEDLGLHYRLELLRLGHRPDLTGPKGAAWFEAAGMFEREERERRTQKDSRQRGPRKRR